ncbi:alkaline phosphatase D family protein [Rhodocytophaga aerolata]|uniref:Alkaline phosphatase D family protein n=1 Tax=Rhodocytophaga aerolata TaxID=455078 RepID=A0ABT8RCM4_9BACT|nr:alkaline phosphatase D family protein [Rhodocytophaga aerolata]MDO1448450.1 alkaline phosphatase D family protein [Rhodocytophaga aerolata]
MKKHVYLFAYFLIFLNITTYAQASLLQAGPMVGYSEMVEVALWVQTTKPAKVKFMYWETAAPQQKRSTEEVTTTQEKAFTALVKADQLQPGKKYTYELYINGNSVKRPYPLQFQSQTLWQWRSDPPEFTFAMGSCAYINEPEVDRPGKPYGSGYEIFTTIHQQKPDFMLWMGDNTYLREVDWNTRSGILHRYTHTRATKELQPLLGSIHHYATWDDHDFGPDNADRSFWNKEITKEAFKLFWANPNYASGEKEGIYGTFQWNDVQFFLLDNRYYKTPNHNFLGKRTLLGADQLQWLIDALIFSKATFKFIVIGNQVINPTKLEDSYTFYPEEKEELLKAIRQANIPGVVFLDGDRHHSVLMKMDREGTYPLYDLTVSPLTAGVAKPWPEEDLSLMVPNTMFIEHNFALLSVKGPRTDRVLTIRLMNDKGTEVWSKEIKASELK